MHARDLMPLDQKSRSRRYYTFPEIEHEGEAISPRPAEKYAICLSFCELYQDRIYDLLDDHQSFIQKRKNLPLKRDVTSGRRFVSGLRKIYADTIEVPPPTHTHKLSLNRFLIERKHSGSSHAGARRDRATKQL